MRRKTLGWKCAPTSTIVVDRSHRNVLVHSNIKCLFEYILHFFFSIKWYSYKHIDLIYFLLFGIHMYRFKNCEIMRKSIIHITGKVALMVFMWFFFSSGNRVKIMTKIRWKVFHANIMPKKLLEVYICIRKTDAN